MSAENAGLPEPRGLARLLDDRWNPILVKEVRQALRGKIFRSSFVFVLTAVVVVTVTMVVDMGSTVRPNESRDFFLGIFACLCIAVIGLVPFTAFNSMGSEWDENTFDLLVISNLKPRQIIVGKLLSACVQALLYYSAFTPFLAFAFLLRGIDLLVSALLLFGAFVASVGVSFVALMFSTFTRVKMLRIFFMAVLAAALSGAVSLAIVSAEELMRQPGNLREPEAPSAILAYVVTTTLIASLCLAVGCNMLAHPEENRSTGVRILMTCSVLITAGFMAWVLSHIGEKEAVSAMSIMLIVWLTPASIFLVSEDERLGRRVAPRVPRNTLYALLAAPWLPGGGRGLLFAALHYGLVLFLCALGHVWFATPNDTFWEEGMLSIVLGALYVGIYLGLPSGVLSRFTGQPKLRAAVRGIIPLCILLMAFAPAVFGFFAGVEPLMEMEHGGHPFYIGNRIWNSGELRFPSVWIAIAVLFGITLLINAPRVYAGVMEVVSASLSRRRREEEARVAE